MSHIRTLSSIGALILPCYSTPMERMSFPEQEAEEQFDRALLEAIDNMVVPNIGNPRISDSVTVGHFQ